MASSGRFPDIDLLGVGGGIGFTAGTGLGRIAVTCEGEGDFGGGDRTDMKFAVGDRGL